MTLIIISLALVLATAITGSAYCLVKLVHFAEKFITQAIYSLYLKSKKIKHLKDKDIVDSTKFIFEENGMQEIRYDEKTKILKPLVDKIRNNISLNNQNLLHVNLQYINLNYLKRMGSIYAGTYNVVKNQITYSREAISCQHNFERIIGHEIYHASSSFYTTNAYHTKIFSGFYQQITDHKYDYSNGPMSSYSIYHNGIGIVLDEGYTELLTQKTFNSKGVYSKEVKIAKLIELFFDDPKDMEGLYFHCNLSGLIEYMENFATREEIIELIIDLDNAYYLQYKYVRGKYNNLIPSLIHMKCQLKLYDWFSKKCNDLEKLRKFEEILFQDENVAMLVRQKNIKLYEQQLEEKNNDKQKTL